MVSLDYHAYLPPLAQVVHWRRADDPPPGILDELPAVGSTIDDGTILFFGSAAKEDVSFFTFNALK